jgi:1-acyl-sn-glycerol-3-phosphate acyltransferase
MPLAPELATLPEMIGSFHRAGLIKELVVGMMKGEKGRDMVADAKRLMKELETKNSVNVYGLENIPKESGCLIVFNHPNMDVLLPAMLELMIDIHEQNDQQIRLAMGSEIPMITKDFNDKTAVPGSIALLRQFHQLYENNIISVPTAENRKDYLTGRAMAVRKMIRAFKQKDVVVISPEGHVEINNSISPADSYHDGSGKLAVLATRMGIPTVPVAIWGGNGKIEVNVGRPFFLRTEESDLVAIEAMSEIARIMPEELRGPFR